MTHVLQEYPLKIIFAIKHLKPTYEQCFSYRSNIFDCGKLLFSKILLNVWAERYRNLQHTILSEYSDFWNISDSTVDRRQCFSAEHIYPTLSPIKYKQRQQNSTFVPEISLRINEKGFPVKKAFDIVHFIKQEILAKLNLYGSVRFISVMFSNRFSFSGLFHYLLNIYLFYTGS